MCYNTTVKHKKIKMPEQPIQPVQPAEAVNMFYEDYRASVAGDIQASNMDGKERAHTPEELDELLGSMASFAVRHNVEVEPYEKLLSLEPGTMAEKAREYDGMEDVEADEVDAGVEQPDSVESRVENPVEAMATNLIRIFNKWDAADSRIAGSERKFAEMTTTIAQSSAFVKELSSSELSDAERNQAIRAVFNGIRPESVENFVSFINGAVIEATVFEDLSYVAERTRLPGVEGDGLEVVHSTPEQDIEGGYDFIVRVKNGEPGAEVLIDAKSGSVYRNLAESGEIEAIPGIDANYAGVRYKDGTRIVVINPEGLSEKQSTISYMNVSRRVHGRRVEKHVPELHREPGSPRLARYNSMIQRVLQAEVRR